MNLELTYSTLYEFHHYIKSNNIISKLQELSQLIQVQLQDPGQHANLVNKINEVEVLLGGKSFYDNQTSVVRDIINAFTLQDFTGERLLLRVKKALTQQPSIAAKEIDTIVTSLDKQFKQVNQVVIGFNSFGIESFEAKKPLLSVTFPREKGFGNAEKYLEELQEIIKTLGYFQELTGPREEIELFSQSSTDPTVFLGISIGTLLMVGKCVEWALDRIEQGVRIVSQIQDIRQKGFEAAGKKTEVEIISDFLAVQIVSKVEEIVELQNNNKNGRAKGELDTNTKIALQRLIEHINAGVKIETQPTFDDEEPEDGVSAEELAIHQANIEAKAQAQSIKYKPGENSSIPLLERKHPMIDDKPITLSNDKPPVVPKAK